MNYANIKYCDIANGPGVRTSLFVSGCTHRCKNCFNDIAWDFSYGELFTEETAEEIIENTRSDSVRGLTLLGGEPLEPENQGALLDFIKKFRECLPNKDIWCFSGYTYEQITGAEKARCQTDIITELLSYFDVLVDGEYIDEEHDITLRFRGSRNQRIIDLAASKEKGSVVLWQDDPQYSTHKLL